MTVLIISAITVSIIFCYLIQYIAEGRHVLNEDIDTYDEM